MLAVAYLTNRWLAWFTSDPSATLCCTLISLELLKLPINQMTQLRNTPLIRSDEAACSLAAECEHRWKRQVMEEHHCWTVLQALTEKKKHQSENFFLVTRDSWGKRKYKGTDLNSLWDRSTRAHTQMFRFTEFLSWFCPHSGFVIGFKWTLEWNKSFSGTFWFTAPCWHVLVDPSKWISN